MKKIIATILLISNIVLLWSNVFLWLYAALSNISLVWEIYIFFNLYVLRSYITEKWLFYGLIIIIIFIIDLLCYKYIKNKLLLTLGSINIVLSPIAMLIYSATH